MDIKRGLGAALMVLAALALLLLGLTGVLADDTGWADPSANTADKGGGFNNAENAYADGGGCASVLGCGRAGVSHRYWDYALAVPASDSIQGIEVRLDYRLAHDGGDNTASVELSWDGGTNWTTAKTDASEPVTETAVYLGGSTDTWGRAWSAGDFNGDSFLVRVTFATTT